MFFPKTTLGGREAIGTDIDHNGKMQNNTFHAVNERAWGAREGERGRLATAISILNSFAILENMAHTDSKPSWNFTAAASVLVCIVKYRSGDECDETERGR